jgi:hypothetical protein
VRSAKKAILVAVGKIGGPATPVDAQTSRALVLIGSDSGVFLPARWKPTPSLSPALLAAPRITAIFGWLLFRETRGARDFLKLRTSEADKVRCGQKHFEALGVSFAVAVTADDV